MLSRNMKLFTIGLIFFVSTIGITGVSAAGNLYFTDHDIELLLNETKVITLELSGSPDREVDIKFEVVHCDVLKVYPNTITVKPNVVKSWMINIVGQSPGHSLLVGYNTTDPNGLDVSQAYLRVTVQHSYILNYINLIVGWTYFFAWSISFYPQIFINWRRKSVVGLNFDFLGLNILGFLLYSIFNIGLYYVPAVESMYFERHPRGTNPVQLNDVVFAVHATFATVITICQAYLYESGSQRVSTAARSLLCLAILVVVVILGLSEFHYITWLDFLYACSTIKLVITLIKYMPQAYMNYQRKSTIGWSIGNVLLDFTGGTLSMAQMMINAYNYDDWASIFGDPTKFGLGLFSVIFDIFFMVQHYILYRGQNYEIFENSVVAS